MTTVIIDTRSKEAKKMVEFLKTTSFAKVIEDKVPNDETVRAMNEVAEGKVNDYKSAKDLMAKLKKDSGVQN
ncbi:MAG TPA: hypothetical protein VKA38_05335 [Draconibacterium sp.]|nr:hypothetical protein [Draconibacterium sp.]